MFVERLELFGFKSFPNRTEVPLARGITAIVGPNGCGKSNISDALRWVLGEQNARTLRGERIQDVIFKGTKTAKPLGLAEVVLNVSNDDGRLPLEYSHVAVARRVFRSGESEFSINKVQCRLKDIRDLFSGTGLGSHGYAVIERDMIDQVLSDKDDARRFLFEEAAGIIRYKQRRKESERRLEGVEQDLTRIEDMIREIDRGTRSLARQAGKVRRWRRVKEEHDRIVLRSAWERWKELREQSLSSNELHRRREDERADLSSRLSVLDAQRESRRLSLLERADALEQSQHALDGAHRTLTSAQEEVRLLATRIEAWMEEEKDLRTRLARSGERRLELEKELVQLSPRGAELAEKLTEAEERSGSASALRAEAERKLREVRTALYEAQQINLDLNATRSGSRQELGARKERRQAAAARLSSLLDHLEAFGERGEHVELSLGKAEEQVSGFEAEIRTAHEERRALVSRLEETRPARQEMVKRLAEREQERAAADSRLRVLSEQHERHAGFDAAVRHLLENREEFEGLVGVAGEEVRVRPGCEAAGRALLGERVQWILVRDEEAAIGAMGRLRELGLGGVTFFPLREAGRTGGEGDPAITELYEHAEAAAPFVGALAASTRLVSALEAAGERRSDEGHPEARRSSERLLTPGGDLREADGTFRLAGGGKEEIEILRREQEIPEIRAAIAELESALLSLRGEIDGLLGQEEEWSERIEELDGSLAERERARGAAVEARTAARTELAMLREEHTRLAQESEQLKDEISRLDEDLARLEGVVGRSETDSVEAQQRFEDLRRASEDQEKLKDERVREAAEREMECLRLRNELAALEAVRRNLEREGAELERTHNEASQRLEERTEEAERSSERVRTLEGSMAGLAAEREAREADLARAREEHGAAQDELFRLDGELREQRERLDSLVSALHAEDVERLTLQGQADQIRDRILEEHAVDLETWAPPPPEPVRPRRRRKVRAAARSVEGDAAEAGAAAALAGAGETAGAGIAAGTDGAAGADGAAGTDGAAGADGAAAAGDAETREEDAEDDFFDEEDELIREEMSGEGMSDEEEGGEAEAAAGELDAAGEIDPKIRLAELKRMLDGMGNLNFLAEEEYKTSRERLEFHRQQAADLTQARADLLEAIQRINETAGQMFEDTFRTVSAHFVATYEQLFPGGEANISLQGNDPLEGDIEISARPRGKRLESIRLLSSGERALTAIALLFAIYLAKPSPVCLLDEVDAPLDDANLERFLALVRKFSERTQFICITHNKKTMETADRLFGVTMQEPGISKIVSVEMDGQGAEILDSIMKARPAGLGEVAGTA